MEDRGSLDWDEPAIAGMIYPDVVPRFLLEKEIQLQLWRLRMTSHIQPSKTVIPTH